MTSGTLVLRSLRFHSRAHLGALLGAAVGSAVLIGALVVGDSVRGSLRAMALARLGGVHYAISTGDRFFLASLPARLATQVPQVKNLIDTTTPKWISDSPRNLASPALLLPAVVIRQDDAARANHVNVLGVDPDTLWPLAGWSYVMLSRSVRGLPPGDVGDRIKAWVRRLGLKQDDVPAIGRFVSQFREWERGETAFINETLAQQLNLHEGDDVIVRIHKPSDLGQDAAIVPRDKTSVALRLKVGRILSATEFGNFNLNASQVPPANLFLPHELLAKNLGLESRANLMLQGAVTVAPNPGSWTSLRARLVAWLRRSRMMSSRAEASPFDEASSERGLQLLMSALHSAW